MLTPAQIQKMREGVEARQNLPKLGPEQFAQCENGPLHGMRVRIESSAEYLKESIDVPQLGTVVAIYEKTHGQPQWLFKGYKRTQKDIGDPPSSSSH